MRAATATAPNSGKYRRSRGHQMGMFDRVRPEAGGAPLWSEVPGRARSAVTELIARKILAHVPTAVPLPAKEVGDDLWESQHHDLERNMPCRTA